MRDWKAEARELLKELNDGSLEGATTIYPIRLDDYIEDIASLCEKAEQVGWNARHESYEKMKADISAVTRPDPVQEDGVAAVHVMPTNDIKPHDESLLCWCNPRRDIENENVIIHNAFSESYGEERDLE